MRSDKFEKSEERFLSAFENMLEGVQMLGHDWRYLYLNHAAEVHNRRPNQELLGNLYMDMWPGIEDTHVFSVIKHCLEQAEAAQLENRFVYPDGEVGWFRLSIQPIPEGILILSFDITDRIKAEAQSNHMKRLYAALSQVNQTIVHVKNHEELYRSICDVSVQFGEFAAAWIGLLDEASGDVHPAAANGLDVDSWPFPIVNIHTGPLSGGLVAQSFHTSRVVISENVQSDERLQSLHAPFQQLGFRSSAVVPFGLRGKTIGTLTLISQDEASFKAEAELRLLDEMGSDISFALDTMQTEAERKQAEQALRESEEKYRSIVENAQEGIIAYDATWHMTFANQRADAIFGYERGEMLGQHIINIILDEDRPYHAERRKRWEHGLQRTTYDGCYKKKDGTPIWLQVSGWTVMQNGSFAGVYTMITDITERKHAEETLREEQRRLQDAQVIGGIGDWEIDMASGRLFYSDEMCRLLERDPALGAPELMEALSYLKPEDAAFMQGLIFHAMQTGEGWNCDLPVRLPSGREAWHHQVGTATKDKDGNVIKILGVAQDVTERKQAEESLRNSEARMVSAITAAGLCLYEENGTERTNRHMSFLDDRMRDLLGIPEDQHYRARDYWIEHVHPDDMQNILIPAIQKFEEQGENIVSAEYRYQHEKLGTIWFRHTAHAIQRNANGDVLRLVGAVIDITERKQNEEALKAAEEFNRETLDSLAVNIAILDEVGKIVAVNRSWHEFAQANGADRARVMEGVNYLSVCDDALGENSAEASAMAAGIRAVMRGDPELFSLEYPCHSQQERRWFNARVTRFHGNGPLRVVVAHEYITERKLAEETISKRNQMLVGIHEVMLAIGAELRLPVLLANIMEKAQSMLNADRGGGIYLYEQNENHLRLVYGSGINAGRNGITIQPGEGVTGRVYQTSQALTIDDYTHWEGHTSILVSEPPSTVMGIPLYINVETIGVLTLIADSHLRRFTDEDVKQAEMFAVEAAIAIKNAQLYQQAQQEILERTQVENKLRMQTERLDLATRSAGIGSWDWDIQKNKLIWDDRMYALYGIELGHFGGAYEAWLNGLHADDRASSQEVTDQSLRGEREYDTEFRVRWPDGSIHWLKANGQVFWDQDRQPLRMVGVNYDITERKQAEEELRDLNVKLEERVQERTLELHETNIELERANHAKGEFLANMSHELRSPLNSILGLSESLLEQRRDTLTERQEKFVQTIESSGHHLLDLINDILDLSKIEAGKFDCFPEIIAIDDICRSSLAFVKTQAVKKSIQLTHTNETGISKIFADPRRLKQILVNLLTNAVKFTPEQGRVMLQIKTEPEENRVQISVIDEGIGIASADLEKLFQPFVQVESQLNRAYEGTGLGLALVQKLTDLHGGSVQVESEVGKGSRFTINLPWIKDMFVEQPASSSDGILADLPAQKPMVLEQEPGNGTILLAEDNAANILTIAEYLESHGYKVTVAHNGLEVLEKAEVLRPDMILMDIQMPAMDGLEATRRLRTDPRFATTPVIALTALAMPGDRERCLEAGANEYMSKPVSLKTLAKTIETMLIAANGKAL